MTVVRLNESKCNAMSLTLGDKGPVGTEPAGESLTYLLEKDENISNLKCFLYHCILLNMIFMHLQEVVKL